VETEEQRAMLERFGCRLWQGYLFGRPAPAEQMLREALGATPAPQLLLNK
jgi:EAL domain-containing protein (putative c-di-GMP-specific phosphodiesterase class I)